MVFGVIGCNGLWWMRWVVMVGNRIIIGDDGDGM